MGINTYSTTIIIWCSGVQWSIVLLLFTKHRHYSARGKKKLFFMPISKGLTNFRVNGKRWSNFVSSLCELPFNLCNKRINFVHPGKIAHTSWVNSDLIFFCNFAVDKLQCYDIIFASGGVPVHAICFRIYEMVSVQ